MNQLLTFNDLAAMFRVSKLTISRWVKQGALPPPVRFGRRVIRWRAEDLQAFVQALPPAVPVDIESEVSA